MKMFMKVMFLHIPQSYPNSILVYDIEYFQKVAIILANAKTQTIRKYDKIFIVLWYFPFHMVYIIDIISK